MSLDIILIDQSASSGFNIALQNENEIEIIIPDTNRPQGTTRTIILNCNQINALKSRFKCFDKLNCCGKNKKKCNRIF